MMISNELFGNWLTQERKQQGLKFSHASQVELLRAGHIMQQTGFAGQAESYWGRLQTIRRSPEFKDRRSRQDLLPLAAQYSGKVTSSLTAIYTTLKTQHNSEYGGSQNMTTRDIVENVPVRNAKTAYHWLDNPDFYDTQTGRGVLYYAQKVSERGIPKTNLGIAADLLLVRSIYLSAAAVAIAQFDECLEETGTLPVGGTSSGNITLHTPEF